MKQRASRASRASTLTQKANIVIFLQPNPDVARDGWNRLTHSDTGPLAGGIPLRVMFIGASMTLGEHSTGEVGYRKQLRDWMVARGNPVNYVGQVFSPSPIVAGGPSNVSIVLTPHVLSEPIW